MNDTVPLPPFFPKDLEKDTIKEDKTIDFNNEISDSSLNDEVESSFIDLNRYINCYYDSLQLWYKQEENANNIRREQIKKLRNHAFFLSNQIKKIYDCRCENERENENATTKASPVRTYPQRALECGKNALNEILNLLYLLDDFNTEIKLALIFLKLKEDLEILNNLMKIRA